MDPLLVSVEDAARALGIGKTLAYELVARGELPRVKVGRRTLIPAQALSEWVDAQAKAARMAIGAPGTAEILSIQARKRRTA